MMHSNTRRMTLPLFGSLCALIATACHTKTEVISVPSSVVRTVTANFDQCQNGGLLVEQGTDLNFNGRLDDAEVRAVVPVCNGTTGKDGENGEHGGSCTVKAGGTSVDIQCEDGSTVRLPTGCTASEQTNGDVLVTCGDSQALLPKGKDGNDGNDGASCFATDNGDGSKSITCGDTVVAIHDGQHGANGKNGQSCDAVANPTTGDTDIICGGAVRASIRSGQDGQSCRAVANPTTGATDIVCGDTVHARIPNGQDGASCAITSQNPTVITCGDTSVELPAPSGLGNTSLACSAADNGQGQITITCTDGPTFTIETNQNNPRAVLDALVRAYSDSVVLVRCMGIVYEADQTTLIQGDSGPLIGAYVRGTGTIMASATDADNQAPSDNRVMTAHHATTYVPDYVNADGDSKPMPNREPCISFLINDHRTGIQLGMVVNDHPDLANHNPWTASHTPRVVTALAGNDSAGDPTLIRDGAVLGNITWATKVSGVPLVKDFTPVVLDWVYSLNMPGIFWNMQAVMGRISSTDLALSLALDRDPSRRIYWQDAFAADLNGAPGASGGPVFDHNGNWIGLVVGSDSNPHNGLSIILPFSSTDTPLN